MTDSAFDLLHPALQYHVVNSLGWSSLRPTQLHAIEPILGRRDCLILAPTAGGKTEAAFVPVLSRMLTEDWRGLSVLYVCPIKALLNNLEPRLSRYAELTGRRVGIWHGDVNASRKEQIRRDPPDVLLTTPESIEGLLISRRSDREMLFSQVQTIIVDELHAFAGDDRGWHLRAVLKRLERFAPQRPQRLGLSATVGNPSDLLRWFSGQPDSAIVGDPVPPKGGELVVDCVGSLEGAATVLARLYRGDKRLVFCDSRSKVETLAGLLRQQDVQTFVSHSSLSLSERKAAETAFAEDRNCVIVATSTLELGVDVGDLDRVIQIDAPGTVSSLLQRMGRTGRRPGMPRNCTFLATNDEGFLVALALCRLLADGYTEPIEPPMPPWHIVAQQAMAIVLERQGVGRSELIDLLMGEFPELARDGIVELVDYATTQDIFTAQDGLIGFGIFGEKEFGGRNFLELVSSFTTPPVVAVRYGASELGFVDPVSVLGAEGASILSLGGRSWRVQSIDWPRRVVWVEPTSDQGKSSWLGSSRALSSRVSGAVKMSLIDGPTGCQVSKRASERIAALREQFDFLAEDATTLEKGPNNSFVWWTFAGGAANATLAATLHDTGKQPGPRSDDWAIYLRPTEAIDLRHVCGALPATKLPESMKKSFAEQLKFSACLPEDLLERTLAARLIDMPGAEVVVAQRLIHASASPHG